MSVGTSGKTNDLILHGVIPEPPYILCKNNIIAEMIQGWLHTHLSREPVVRVCPEKAEWPYETTAIVVTPLNVVGATKSPSFRIEAVQALSREAKAVIEFWMRWKMTHDGLDPTTKQISTSVYGSCAVTSLRQVDYAMKEIEASGLLTRIDTGKWKTNFGKWAPDASVAKAAGLKIVEYK